MRYKMRIEAVREGWVPDVYGSESDDMDYHGDSTYMKKVYVDSEEAKSFLEAKHYDDWEKERRLKEAVAVTKCNPTYRRHSDQNSIVSTPTRQAPASSTFTRGYRKVVRVHGERSRKKIAIIAHICFKGPPLLLDSYV